MHAQSESGIYMECTGLTLFLFSLWHMVELVNVCAGDGDFSRELLSANCWIHSDPHVTHKNSTACHVTGSTQSLVHSSPQMSKTATLDR